MPLSGKQNRYLRGRAHNLRPVVMIGNAGLTQGVIDETHRALHDHELIKVRVSAEDRESRKAMAETLCTETDAEFVQLIGHVAVLYRPGEPPIIQLP